ncbi:uncharacterized protein JCM15063_003668 [Sporobolomyces koalae]|uniref:uncharacterized protein n=1 Tax=Sporobolomyces koalae TaxID=500713 RepID=UPI00317E3C58
MLRFISINFAVTIAAAPLAILLTFLLLYIVTHPKLRGQDGTKASKRPLTLTQHNTLLNRNENGGTGVWSRKWRRKVATALSMAPMRRGLGDLDEDDDESDEDDGGSSSDTWTLKADPAPPGLRGCLKRERSFEQVKQAVAQGETDESQLKLSLEPPSPSTSSASSASFYSPPLAPPSPDLSHRPAIATRKSVTIEEPCLAELEALRNLWDRPEMQSTVNISGNGGVGYGGIAGYRRTRDHYARGQGGRGINKSAVPAPVPAISPSPANPKAPRIEKTDDGSPRPRRPLNAAISSRSSSSSSLSPSPVMRRPIVKRAVSPGANTIVVGSASGRRRIPSPSNSSLATRTSSSISPAPTSERVQPRWIKSKKSPSRTSSTGSEKRVPPRPLDHDDDQDEENEEGGTGKNGTMSATVTDDEDGFEDEDVDDDRSVPPSRQGSSQAPPNITANLHKLAGLRAGTYTKVAPGLSPTTYPVSIAVSEDSIPDRT